MRLNVNAALTKRTQRAFCVSIPGKRLGGVNVGWFSIEENTVNISIQLDDENVDSDVLKDDGKALSPPKLK